MSRYTIICIIAALTMIVGCKHNHKPPSEELKQAYAIQKEALKINASIDDSALSTTWKAKRKAWLDQMIEVPGMDHDHSNCNHDHHRQTISITDEEMIAVQTAWRDTIIRFKKEIQSAAQ